MQPGTAQGSNPTPVQTKDNGTTGVVATALAVVAIVGVAVWAFPGSPVGGGLTGGDGSGGGIGHAGTPPMRIVVPRTREKIDVNAELDEPAWKMPARTGPFLFPGSTEAARPYSDARFLRDDDNLYLGLYAADQDVHRGTDAFRVAFRDPSDGSILTLSIAADKEVLEKKITADGKTLPWASHIRLAVDVDGTFDDPSDEDEEWVVEAAIPFSALDVDSAHASSLTASVARCDTPKGSKEACGAWGLAPDGGVGGTLVLGN